MSDHKSRGESVKRVLSAALFTST